MSGRRSTRLIHLVTEMKTTPRRPPEELWRLLGISKTQFYEDKRKLETELGFKFKFDRETGCFQILADPLIPVFNLTMGEIFSLVMAVRQLSAAGDFILSYEALQAIRKIIAEAPLEKREVLRSCLEDVVLQEGFGCEANILEALRQAREEQRRVVISHQPPHEAEPKRWTIDAYEIFFKRRALYLDAYCPEERCYLIFRINRIQTVQPLGLCFARRKDYSFARRHRNAFSVFVGEAVQKVAIKFQPRIVHLIKENLWHHSQKCSDLPTGELLMELEVSEPREVGWWAMQWGVEAEIVEPEELRRVVAAEARRMVEIYDGKR